EVDRKRHGFSGRHSQRRSTVGSDGAIRIPRASNPGATVLEWGLIPLFSWNQRVKTLPPTKARDHVPRFGPPVNTGQFLADHYARPRVTAGRVRVCHCGRPLTGSRASTPP